MKTAVSIPDEVYAEAEQLARRLNTSRSQLYAKALTEFINRHSDDPITAAMNRVVESVDADDDQFSQEASRQTLKRVEW